MKDSCMLLSEYVYLIVNMTRSPSKFQMPTISLSPYFWHFWLRFAVFAFTLDVVIVYESLMQMMLKGMPNMLDSSAFLQRRGYVMP